jgi:hypothetical protein
MEALQNVTHVRLDRENIAEIDGLDVLDNITHLYLQFVRIEVWVRKVTALLNE